MITVIIAGGSGTRLWPLSTHKKPKQLIELLNGISPLQESYDRVKGISSDVYVVPETRLINDIKERYPQFDDEHIIVEPGLRGTASCYILALDVITRKHTMDEPIAFIWADHHVRNVEGFEDSLKTAAEEAVRHKRLVTIGIEPTYPAALGYIERGGEVEERGVYDVISFKEKPDPDTAREYIRQGNYLWNSGYYVGTADSFLKAMQQVAPDLYDEYQKLHIIEDQTSKSYQETYLGFENLVIDVALSEKMKDLLVVPACFDWLDIGNFKDLHEASDRDNNNNYFAGENIHAIDVENVYVRNEDSKPVAVIGLDNIVVVNTPDGILVARKDMSHRVGEVAKALHQ